MTEAMRHAYRDRNTYLGDPAFVDNPIARALVGAHTRNRSERRSSRIAPRRPRRLPAIAASHEHATTTHYSMVDPSGNAVSVTYTINDDFGAKVIAGDTGFFLERRNG